MSGRDSLKILAKMQEAAIRANSFIEGMSRAEFSKDPKTQDAVAMSLIHIGEAASVLMRQQPGIDAAYPQIRWRELTGMRERMTQSHYNLDTDLLWNTAHDALPALAAALASATRSSMQVTQAQNSNTSNGKS